MYVDGTYSIDVTKFGDELVDQLYVRMAKQALRTTRRRRNMFFILINPTMIAVYFEKERHCKAFESSFEKSNKDFLERNRVFLDGPFVPFKWDGKIEGPED